MELFLWRHADALSGRSDFDRELSPFGHKQAAKAAELFREYAGPVLDQMGGIANLRILVSPAARTRQTIAHLCEDENKIELCMPLYENASTNEILKILGWPDITMPVLIVGHEPQVGLIADRLLADTPHPLSFRKSALWWLRINSGQKIAQLVRVIEP